MLPTAPVWQGRSTQVVTWPNTPTPLASPSPSELSCFSWEASRVPAPRTHRARFLGRCYLAAILHFLPKKLQSPFFNTYLLKTFSHYSKEYLNGRSKPHCLMTANLLKNGGKGGFALGGGRENKEKSARLQRAHFHNCPVTLAK